MALAKLGTAQNMRSNAAGVCWVFCVGALLVGCTNPLGNRSTVSANFDAGLPPVVATATAIPVPADHAPVAAAFTESLVEDTAKTIALAYTDAEGDQATECTVSNASHISADACSCSAGACSVQITPDANFNGTASFDYTVTANGLTSAAATATLTIDAVNDAPALAAGGDTSATVNESASVSIAMKTVTDPDVTTDSQSLTYLVTANPSHGALTNIPINASTGGSVTYTADSNWGGTDSFSYIICDNYTSSACTGAVTVTVSVVDNTPPTVSVGSPSGSSVNSASAAVTYAVTYTGATTINLAAAGVTLNATGTATCSGKIVSNGTTSTPTVSLTNCTGDGAVGIRIAANTSSDPVGNQNLASSVSTTFVVDNTGPTVSIGSPSSSAVNNGTDVTYSVTFSGGNSFSFDSTDVTLNTTGTAACSKAVANGNTAAATVTLSGCTGDGTVGISVAADSASDTVGNNSTASAPSNTFIVDNTSPTVVVGTPSTSLAKNSTSITFSVTYSGGAIYNLTAAGITLNTTGGASCSKAVSNGTTATPTVTLSNCTGDGTVGITINTGTASDALGNSNTVSAPSTTFTVDTTPPTVAVGAPTPGSWTAITESISFPITFIGGTTHNLTAGDVTLNATGGASCTVGVTNGTTATPTVTLTSCTGEGGTVGITVAANTASDVAGNANSASAASSTFTVSSVVPSPTLDLSFASSGALDSRVTFTRASTATYVGSDGLIKTAAINTPRFDYNPTTRESLGLLIEESRTNLVAQSENFTSSAWTQLNLSESLNVAIAPDGSATADKVADNTVNAAHNLRKSTASNVTSGFFVTGSVYIKPAGRTKAMVRFDNTGAFSADQGARFDFTAVTGSVSNGTPTASISDAGNGWYRCSITQAATATGLVTLVVDLVDSSGNTLYAGDGVSGLYLWGAQVEVGTATTNGAFPTSYIPTTTAAVTRVADLAQISGANFTGFYNNTAGSILAEARTYNAAAASSGNSSNYLFNIDDTSTDNNNTFSAYSNSSGTTSFLRVSNTTAASSYQVRPTGGLTKTAIGIQNNNYNSYVDGLQSSNSNTVGTPFTPTFVNIGSAYSAGVLEGFWNGHVSRLRYWNARMSNAALQELTQPTPLITSFQFTAAANSGLTTDVIATIAGTNITATVPASATALKASFVSTGVSVTVGGSVQNSGVSVNDFSSPVTYVVTAADGRTTTYTVTVTVVPWTPAYIATALWLDASDSNTVTLASGAVSQWNDKSGNGRHATQATASQRPVQVIAGLNGRDIVRFDGANDAMSSPFTYIRGLTQFEVFVVFSKIGDGVGSGGYFPLLSTVDDGGLDLGALHYIKSTNNGASYPNYSGWGNYDNTSSYTNGAWYLSEFLAESTTWRVLRNVVQESSGNTNSIGINATIDNLGISYQLNPLRYARNDYAEILITINTGAPNRQRIEGYLAHKWGTTSSLPSDHPYKLAPP